MQDESFRTDRDSLVPPWLRSRAPPTGENLQELNQARAKDLPALLLSIEKSSNYKKLGRYEKTGDPLGLDPKSLVGVRDMPGHLIVDKACADHDTAAAEKARKACGSGGLKGRKKSQRIDYSTASAPKSRANVDDSLLGALGCAAVAEKKKPPKPKKRRKLGGLALGWTPLGIRPGPPNLVSFPLVQKQGPNEPYFDLDRSSVFNNPRGPELTALVQHFAADFAKIVTVARSPDARERVQRLASWYPGFLVFSQWTELLRMIPRNLIPHPHFVPLHMIPGEGQIRHPD